MTIVKAEDCQALGFCMKSVRIWANQHNIDFRAFVRNGVDAEILLATDDEFARQAVAQARKRELNSGG